jgi:hypothetical protein
MVRGANPLKEIRAVPMNVVAQAAVHEVRRRLQPFAAMSRTRKRTSTQTKVVEGFPALGAAIGLVTADPGVAGPCRGTTSSCVSESLGASLQPYITGALAGAIVGLAVGLALIMLLRYRKGPAQDFAARREAIPERVRHEVWRRDLGTCVECGSRARLEFDHIIPVSRGGSNTTRNIELRCEPCNRRKGARI